MRCYLALACYAVHYTAHTDSTVSITLKAKTQLDDDNKRATTPLTSRNHRGLTSQLLYTLISSPTWVPQLCAVGVLSPGRCWNKDRDRRHGSSTLENISPLSPSLRMRGRTGFLSFFKKLLPQARLLGLRAPQPQSLHHHNSAIFAL